MYCWMNLVHVGLYPFITLSNRIDCYAINIIKFLQRQLLPRAQLRTHRRACAHIALGCAAMAADDASQGLDPLKAWVGFLPAQLDKKRLGFAFSAAGCRGVNGTAVFDSEVEGGDSWGLVSFNSTHYRDRAVEIMNGRLAFEHKRLYVQAARLPTRGLPLMCYN